MFFFFLSRHGEPHDTGRPTGFELQVRPSQLYANSGPHLPMLLPPILQQGLQFLAVSGQDFRVRSWHLEFVINALQLRLNTCTKLLKGSYLAFSRRPLFLAQVAYKAVVKLQHRLQRAPNFHQMPLKVIEFETSVSHATAEFTYMLLCKLRCVKAVTKETALLHSLQSRWRLILRLWRR